VQLALPGDFTSTVESVVRCRDNGPLIAAAATLWIKPDDLVIDATYGRGKFWTCYRPERLVMHDIALDGVDFRHLPEADRSVDAVVFDPPYVAPGGRDTSSQRGRLDNGGFIKPHKGKGYEMVIVAVGSRRW
jgi:hypothetical protein